ncbi:LptF/LptG family permease [Bacteroidales bacterium]|nr:LptF/LptG family permease [Bacteroidales bacterium]
MSFLGLKKIDIYIIKKFLGTYFLAIILIIFIAIIFDLSEKIDDFIENGAPVSAIIFDYFLNFAPYLANLFSYLFTFIAVIFFTSKMAYNTEIIAILSNAVSYQRMLVPYLVSATIISSISFTLAAWVIPRANAERFEFEEQYYYDHQFRFSEKNVHKQIEPGLFVYIESYSNSQELARRFSLERIEDGKLISKLTSNYAVWDSTINKWSIFDYSIREFDGEKEILTQGNQIDTTLNLHPEYFAQRENVIEAMTLKELNYYIDDLIMQGANGVIIAQIEKAKRFAGPFSTFILTVLGVSVSSRKVRGGIGGHLGIGVAASFSYIFFQQFAAQFSIGGYISPTLAVWIPNILYGIITYMFYRKAPK